MSEMFKVLEMFKVPDMLKMPEMLDMLRSGGCMRGLSALGRL